MKTSNNFIICFELTTIRIQQKDAEQRSNPDPWENGYKALELNLKKKLELTISQQTKKITYFPWVSVVKQEDFPQHFGGMSSSVVQQPQRQQPESTLPLPRVDDTQLWNADPDPTIFIIADPDI